MADYMKENFAKSFLEAMMNLASEIADKGSRGEQLTDAEKAFIRESTMFMLTGLLSRRDG